MPPLAFINNIGEVVTGEPRKQPQAEQIDKPSTIEELFKLAAQEAEKASSKANQRSESEQSDNKNHSA